MSSRRVTPQASTPLATNCGSRLAHVLSVGMSNLSINEPTVTPEHSTKFSFANAHKARVLSVSTAMPHKKTGVVPQSDIDVDRVTWVNWDEEKGEEAVKKWTKKINVFLTSSYHNLMGKRDKIHDLAHTVLALGSDDGVAALGSVNRDSYVYLLQVLEAALRKGQVLGQNDAKFEETWVSIINEVDKKTTERASAALSDPEISNDARDEIFAYFDAVNQNVYNYFTDGDIVTTPSLAENISPMLTAYLNEFRVEKSAGM